MAGTPAPPPGWVPMGNGSYRNPASGTVIYPNGKGGWTGDPSSGVGQGALGASNANADHGLSATHGRGPHGAAGLHPGGMTMGEVYAMQRFLVNHGFNIAQDGILGPITKAAAAAFRANHKGGDAFNASHGLGVHPASRAPVPRAGSHVGAVPPGKTPPMTHTTPAAPDPASGAFNGLLGALLKGGGNIGSEYDPGSFGDAAAAPDVALASSLVRQIRDNPKQEAQNQYDISSWYGLDPSDPNYGLSVLGRLGLATSRDAQANTDAQGNVADIAKSLAGSIGGAANGASGSVLAAGADAAGMFGALGQEAKDYGATLDPLLAAEARGQMSREKASNSQALADLKDRLAQAQGAEASDRAQGVMAATDKNNSLSQQRFANQGNLLSILSQMMSVDPTYNGLRDAKLAAQIDAINHPAAKTPSSKSASLGDITMQVAGMLGMPAGSMKIPNGTSVGGLAHVIGSALQAAGIPKSDPRYQRLGQTIINSFLDPNGNPLRIPTSWFGPTTR